MAFSLGYDIGSSSIKCVLLDLETGRIAARSLYPAEEMSIDSPRPGWAEQDPEMWWENVKLATRAVLNGHPVDPSSVKSIGISYQMHGLVVVDKNLKVLRPSIIWCDSRAVEIGKKAFREIGPEYCLSHLLNSPANFTASKLKWVKDQEPELYRKINRIMLPGDYIAARLTGEINSTLSGMSEGIFWDFHENRVSDRLLHYYNIDKNLLPGLVPTFSIQGTLTPQVARELGLVETTVVSYRAGDQPNNAFSLRVLEPGEIAATAGTSGVVYGITGELRYDPRSRVNQFAHVNHSAKKTSLGILLCINGAGILYSWLRKNAGAGLSYDAMNDEAAAISPGSDGLSVLPFGNGAERVLENRNIGARVLGIDLTRHSRGHLLRASQEGIAFSLKYGTDIMKQMGLDIRVIRAGKTNLFLSPVFRQTLSTLTGATIELFETDGAEGAARGSAVGAGLGSLNDVFGSLKTVETVTMDTESMPAVHDAYGRWVNQLSEIMK